MSGANTDHNPSNLETKVAAELGMILENSPASLDIKIKSSDELCFLLEYYIPELLLNHYPEWAGESLDGFFVSNARKIGTGIIELTGLCILISDQTVTPFFIRLALTSSHDSIASYTVLLGEPGDGSLGISGPPCNSLRAQKLLETVDMRVDMIQWSFSVTSETLH